MGELQEQIWTALLGKPTDKHFQRGRFIVVDTGIISNGLRRCTVIRRFDTTEEAIAAFAEWKKENYVF